MKYQPRTIILLTDTQKQTAISAINNAPVGNNLEVVIREHKKARNNDQNALYWSGVLADISQQVWLNGRQYSAEIWHEHFKPTFMPDEATEPYIHEHVTKPETYRKWEYMPDGIPRCIASTTDLTKYGFAQYLEQIYAFGASHGVMFTVKDES